MVLSDSQWFYFKTANVIGTKCFPLDTWPKKMVHNFPILSSRLLNSYMFSPSFFDVIYMLVFLFLALYIKWICKIDFKAFTIKSTSVWEFHCWFWLLTLFADLLANVACKILLVNFCLLILACLFCLLDDNFCIMLAREFCWLGFADWILFAGSCLLDHTFLDLAW